MIGRILAGVIVITALVAGVAMYYLQVYYFYEEVSATGTNDVQLTSLVTGEVEAIPYQAFEAIDANSSPIRYRACFTTSLGLSALTETYAPYAQAAPRLAPGWFECFDAKAIGAALEDGSARAFLGQRDVIYGIDRVVAVFEDGRGYVWHEINRCGAAVFDGNAAPEGCATPPERN